jgi:class 3 adenylate cyclase
MSCGAAVAEVARVDVRKTVTALSCDVADSTKLAERLDPEALRATMERWFAEVQGVLVRHGGTVEKFVGDAVMAVFGAPVAHEDDALRACRAALEILEITAAEGRFAVRVGLETGEVLVGDVTRASTFASGVPVILAARLQAAAGPGEALLGPACLRLVRDHVVVEPRRGLSLKNVAEPLDAALLVAADDARDDVVGASVPLVGRTRELSLLRQAFERAAVDRTCQLATVLGVAGMGKTRIADEFLASLAEGVTVLRGRCVSYGEGVTYWPLVQAVRQAAGLDGGEPVDQARERVAALLGAARDAVDVVNQLAPVIGLGGSARTSDDTSWAMRRLLAALAEARPVVYVVEDLHWAEPGLVSLLEDVSTWLRDAPVLLLVNARPEFLDDNPGWGAGRTNGVTALLEPLAPEELRALTTEVVGGLLPEGVAQRVRDVSGGNPLYVQHLLAVLIDDGVLARGRQGWELTGDVDSVNVPPTISALISARLDRLEREERRVLGVAAVMGQVFYRSAVAELAGRDAAGPALTSLIRKGLVEPAESELAGQQSLQFGHVLLRDAAYDALPKTVRAELHLGFARWLDRVAEGQAVDDLVGNHLELAYLARADLGDVDDATTALGREAADRLLTAARMLIFTQDDGALGLLERAEQLIPGGAEPLWGARLDRIRVLVGAFQRLTEARQLTEELAAEAARAGSERWTTIAELLRLQIEQDTSPDGVTDRMSAAATRALERYADPPDHEVLLVAHDAMQRVATMHGDLDGLIRHYRELGRHAAMADRLAEADAIARGGLMPLLIGSADLRETLARAETRWRTDDSRLGRLLGGNFVWACARLVGEDALAEEAERAVEAEGREARSRMLYSDSVDFIHGMVHLAFGQWDAAHAVYLANAEHHRRASSVSILSTQAVWVALLDLWRGNHESARRWRQLGLETTSADDLATLAPAAVAGAWLAARDGNQDRARRLLEDAPALFEQMLLDRAALERAIAEVHRLLGNEKTARQHLAAAADLYRRKGAWAVVADLEAKERTR